MKLLPAALVVVVVGIVLQQALSSLGDWMLQAEHLVTLPVLQSVADLGKVITLPDFSAMGQQEVWIVAATLAIVASLETLLCIEAGDNMDPHKRYTNPNRELLAQGVGNALSGLIGGLPMTSVVVHHSQYYIRGEDQDVGYILHGLFLLVCVMAIPGILNKIPLASLAAILLMIGYKLAHPSKIFHFYKQGKYQFFHLL